MATGQRNLGVNIGGTEDNDVHEKRSIKSKEVDFESGSADAAIVAPVYYNPTTMKFEWAQRPSISIDDLTVSMGDVEKLLSMSYWLRKKYDWTSGDLDYMGLNSAIDAAEGDATWYVFKFTWSVGGDIELIDGPKVGTWSGRAALF